MNPRPPHPLPPVVRWAVFPALSGLAGATGAVFSGLLIDPTWHPGDVKLAAIGSGLGMGAALAAAISLNPWIALTAGFAAGLQVCVSVYAVHDAIRYGSPLRPTPFGLYSDFNLSGNIAHFYAPLVWIQAAVLVVVLRSTPPRGVPNSLILHGLAAFWALLTVTGLPQTGQRGLIHAVAFFGTFFLAASTWMSLALARRLQML